MHRPFPAPAGTQGARSHFSEESAVVLGQRLADATQPDKLREDVAAHCDDLTRIGVVQAMLIAGHDPGDRLYARVARRREAIVALEHAERHFTMRARQADSLRDQQLADALRHATRSSRHQVAAEIDNLTLRHEQEAALRHIMEGVSLRTA